MRVGVKAAYIGAAALILAGSIGWIQSAYSSDRNARQAILIDVAKYRGQVLKAGNAMLINYSHWADSLLAKGYTKEETRKQLLKRGHELVVLDCHEMCGRLDIAFPRDEQWIKRYGRVYKNYRAFLDAIGTAHAANQLQDHEEALRGQLMAVVDHLDVIQEELRADM